VKFEEKNAITLPKIKKQFIYFLIKNDEVVYVGQTKKQGLRRPFSHTDKDFEEVKIICYEEEKIDMMEDYYIKKYMPKYNKNLNYSENYSLMRARNKLRIITKNNKLSLTHLKKYIKKYDIETFACDDKAYIDVNNYKKLVCNIMGE
jgi:hypothetical protein